jgi:hypothetical protein
MANKIQIKRSTTNAAPTGLANGELAYTANGEILFIGHPDGTTGSIAIGGKRAPGTLTANQALVANSTLGIDKVIVANLTPTQIYANGSIGSAGYVLSSGAGGNVHWVEPTAGVAGSNSQIQFNANGSLSGDAGFTIDGVTDTVTLGGAAQTTAPKLIVSNTSTSANLTSGTLTIGTSVVNSTAVASGANVYLTTSTLFAGNSTVNASHTSALMQVSNSTSTANLTAAGLTIGTVIANTTGLFVGANVFANSSAVDVGNTIIASALLTLGGQVNANGGVGLAGQVLTSGSTGNVYWTTPTTGTVTSVTGGNGLTGSVTSSGALDVGEGAGISVTTDAVAVKANNGIIANTSGVFADAANGISVDASGINVLGSNAIVSNSSGVHLLTGSTLTVNTTGVHVNSSLSLTDLTLSGNLDINGTLTTVDTTNLSVTDSIISLARGQTTANTLDIGFYGTFGNATATSYSGLFRDATDGVYKLFAGQIPEPGTTVDTANVNFAYATLQSFITTGALVANSSAVNITANSTVSVALTANSLSLSTALPATSGGTGQSAYAIGDLLVGGAGNTLAKLTVGADGKVLQSNGTSVVYADLDGGTF